MRKYSLNESYFENIDTPEKAYWLGFITADGCINKDRHGRYVYLQVSLSEIDSEHLEKLSAALQYTGIVSHYSSFNKNGAANNYCKLVIYSQKIVNDLRAIGVTEKKSLIVKPWIGPERLMNHYWRGLLDGDGTLHIEKNGQPRLRFNGTVEVVRSFSKFSKSICGSEARLFPHKSIYTYVIGGTNKVGKLVQVLYGNRSIALTRKNNIAKEIMGKYMCERGVA